MNYIALYRKWRPMTFDEVVEQKSVVTILKNTVMSRRIAHAYLFCGTRGTGKTSIAKIFSRAVNCLNPVNGNPCNQCEICKGILNGGLLDVQELDAASNNGVDSIRDIIEESGYHTSRAEFKVFIIDEVHMLSTAAFNALLKTLEEPPENVIFILATTEPHKLPVTILSRCQRYDFKRITADGIVSRLEEICHTLDIEVENTALRYIAGKADGALRDAISLLDQTIASCDNTITLADARKAVGSIDREVTEDFARAILTRDSFHTLELVERIFSEGADPSNFIAELIEFFRALMIIFSTRQPEKLIYESKEDIERMKKFTELTNLKEITMMIRELSALDNDLKWAVQRKIVFEAGVLSLCDRSWGRDTEISDRVQHLERSVADLVAKGLKVAYSGGVPISAPVQEKQETVPEAAENNDNSDDNEDNYREILSNNLIEKADPNDWRDFLDNLFQAGKKGLSGMLSNFGTAYPVGKRLYISFSAEQLMGTMKLDSALDILNDCATRAFGRPLKVFIKSETDFNALVPELAKGSVAEEDEELHLNEVESGLAKMVSGGSAPKSSEPAQTSPISAGVMPIEEAPPEQEDFDAPDIPYGVDDDDDHEEFPD